MEHFHEGFVPLRICINLNENRNEYKSSLLSQDQQNLNELLPSRKFSIKAPDNCKTSIYVLNALNMKSIIQPKILFQNHLVIMIIQWIYCVTANTYLLVLACSSLLYTSAAIYSIRICYFSPSSELSCLFSQHVKTLTHSCLIPCIMWIDMFFQTFATNFIQYVLTIFSLHLFF